MQYGSLLTPLDSANQMLNACGHELSDKDIGHFSIRLSDNHED